MLIKNPFFVSVLVASLIVNISLFLSHVGWEQQKYPPIQDRGRQTQTNQTTSNEAANLQIECNPNCTAKNSDGIRNSGLGMRIVNKLIDDPATSGILIANFLLVIAVLTQVGDGRRTTKRELRAYLTVVVGGAVYQERPKNLKFEAKPVMLNTGRTPAHKVRYRAAAQILTHPLPAEFRFNVETPFVGSGVLGLGGNFILNAVVPDFVDDSEVSSIKKGEGGRFLFVWGEVSYEDVFGEPYWVEFCQRLYWVKGPQEELVGGYYDERHNDSD
jgi:hypothetical protein